MKGTAKLYGLEISKYIDERRDVELSTEKALLYLSTLYDIYGNWTTALAAYNCGPGNINKAIKKLMAQLIIGNQQNTCLKKQKNTYRGLLLLVIS